MKSSLKAALTVAMVAICLTSFSAEARFLKYPAEQGNPYITKLSELGKNQYNYKEFKKVLATLAAQGYKIDPSQMKFLAENVQQMKENNNRLHDWIDFAIEVNFTDKLVTKDGVTSRLSPFVRALGRAEEVCDSTDQNCSAPTNVEFSSYELGWVDRAQNLGGGTSSAGSK